MIKKWILGSTIKKDALLKAQCIIDNKSMDLPKDITDYFHDKGYPADCPLCSALHMDCAKCPFPVPCNEPDSDYSRSLFASYPVMVFKHMSRIKKVLEDWKPKLFYKGLIYEK